MRLGKRKIRNKKILILRLALEKEAKEADLSKQTCTEFLCEEKTPDRMVVIRANSVCKITHSAL